MTDVTTEDRVATRRRWSAGRTTDARAIWNSMPGWGLAANLTPPELIDKRNLMAVRRRLGFALLGCVILIIAGFGYGKTRVADAEDQVADASLQTARLHAEESRFSRVTELKAQVAKVTGQLSRVMQRDVDAAALLGRLNTARPAGVELTGINVAVESGAAGVKAAGSLDLSGDLHVGTVQLQGTGHALTDASAYVERLAALPGVVDVLPTSNAQTGADTTFTITLTLTDELLTGRYGRASSAAPSRGAK